MSALPYIPKKSKCPKCENGTFEAKMNPLGGEGVGIVFIQCAACGTVVGVVSQ